MCVCVLTTVRLLFSLGIAKLGFTGATAAAAPGGGSQLAAVCSGGVAREVYQRKKTIAAFRSFIGGCLIVFYEVASRFVAPRLPFD